MDTANVCVQLETGHSDEKFPISGYEEKSDHYVNLTDFDPQYRHIIRALTRFTNKVDNYAHYEEVSYENAFTIDKVFDRVCELAGHEPWPEVELYVVAYYSSLDKGLSVNQKKALAALDEKAFVEAIKSNALLKYWYGVPQLGSLRNLATCKFIRFP